MKSVWRVGVILSVLGHGLLWPILGVQPDQAGAQAPQRKPVPAVTLKASLRRPPGELPFYRLAREISGLPFQADPASQRGRTWAKLQFAPGKILGRRIQPLPVVKKLPQLARNFNQGKLLPNERITRTQPGLVFEFEPGYGIHQTFIGRLQHGTQFKGAHYYVSGHRERTDGKDGAEREQTSAAQAKIDVDLSASAKVFLDSTFFQSDTALPELPADPHQEKSAIQLIAGLQVKFEPNVDCALTFSGEKAEITDPQAAAYDLRSYGAQLNIKQLWSINNMVSFQAASYRDEYLRAAQSLRVKSYGTGTLTNSFALHNRLTVEAGVQFDYYQAEDGSPAEYLLAPAAAARLHLLRNTSLYATYHPRLKFPRFTDLYIRKLYTTVNPGLFAEKDRLAVEAGVQQRFGDGFALNVGLFYHDIQHLILQIDANNDHLLEYDQSVSTDMMGVKANLQMNYSEQFAQNITYTYTKHNIFTGQRLESSETDGAAGVLPYQPNHQVQASLYWKTPFGLTIDCSGTYVSEQFRNWDRTQNRIGRRFFLNANLTQRITDNFQIFLLGRNLTDTNTADIIPLLDSEEITSSQLFIGGIRLRF